MHNLVYRKFTKIKILKDIVNVLVAPVLIGLTLSFSNIGFLYAKDKNLKTQKSEQAAEISYLVEGEYAKKKVVANVLTAVGHLKANLDTDLSFNASGVLKKLHFKIGQRVSRGDIIATLDDATDQLNLETAKAQLLFSENTYKSNKVLFDKGEISNNTLIKLKSSYLQDKVAVELGQQNINNKVLRAPFDGFLGEFDVSRGQYIAQGAKIVSLLQISPLKVGYSLPSSDQGLITLAQGVKITSSALPGQVFPGLLTFKSQYVDPLTGTLTLQAQVKNPNYLLLPGMFVQVSQIVDPDRKLLVVPSIALQTDIVGEFVYIIKDKVLKDGKWNAIVKTQRVTAELVGKEMMSITKGLKEGDLVVSSGQQKLHDGAKVVLDNTIQLERELKKIKNKK